MTIQLDQPRSTVPVLGVRDFGQTTIGMVVNKEQRASTARDGAPKLNSKGAPAQEEVLTVLILEGNTSTISGGDLEDDYVPEPGTLARIIASGYSWGKLIDARKAAGGGTQVGDVVTQTATAATIWRGKGDIAREGVTDPAEVARARAKGLSVGFTPVFTYRRALPAEKALVERCEALHMELREGITLDTARDDEPPF